MAKPYQRLLAVSGRLIIVLFAIFLIIGISAIGYNNRDVEMPSDTELSASLEASTVWLVENKESVLDVNNPVLWYFLHRAAEVSSDQRIQSLVDTYYNRYIKSTGYRYNKSQSIWIGMFRPGFKVSALPFERVNRMPYYVKHFVYAVNCDEELGQLDGISAQNAAGFCGSLHLLRPTCTTHQLMGIRFLQRSDCGDKVRLASTVEALQSKIVRELIYDPRVLDIYIQRAMLLIESGNPDAVKNVWIRRILDQQNPDGGWGNFQPLILLDDDEPLYLGFGHGKSQTGNPRAGVTLLRIFGIGQPRSTFHATAQGILLLTLLADNSHQRD